MRPTARIKTKDGLVMLEGNSAGCGFCLSDPT